MATMTPLLKNNISPLLFLTHPLPCGGSGIYPVTKEQQQEVIQVKNKLFSPRVSEQETQKLKTTVGHIVRGILFLQGIEQLYCQKKA